MAGCLCEFQHTICYTVISNHMYNSVIEGEISILLYHTGV